MNRKVTSLLSSNRTTSIPVPGRAQGFSADVIYVVPSSSTPARCARRQSCYCQSCPAKAALPPKLAPPLRPCLPLRRPPSIHPPGCM